jgi:hypothetical protein
MLMAKAKKLSTGGLNISEGSVVFNNEATELRKTWMQNAPRKVRLFKIERQKIRRVTGPIRNA